jgi:putative redox protein
MVEIKVRYSGSKKCDLQHPEGSTLRTDAPKDIGGEATAFSPTDLVAAALSSCILTTIATTSTSPAQPQASRST